MHASHARLPSLRVAAACGPLSSICCPLPVPRPDEHAYHPSTDHYEVTVEGTIANYHPSFMPFGGEGVAGSVFIYGLTRHPKRQSASKSFRKLTWPGQQLPVKCVVKHWGWWRFVGTGPRATTAYSPCQLPYNTRAKGQKDPLVSIGGRESDTENRVATLLGPGVKGCFFPLQSVLVHVRIYFTRNCHAGES